MRFRFGLYLGFAVGYVLGAKAGRERYEQIRARWHVITSTRPAQQFTYEARRARADLGGAGLDRIARLSDLAPRRRRA